MDENKREGAFIPCGDSLEKMDEIRDDELENVSGGDMPGDDIIKDENMIIIPII